MGKDARRLGRGIRSLISPEIISDQAHDQIGSQSATLPGTAAAGTASQDTAGPRQIPLDAIQPRADQPRRSFHSESIAQLARSIIEHGIVQPIVVRPVSVDPASESAMPIRYEIIAGERRWRAARSAAIREVPVIIRNANDDEAFELALIENIQREDLNAIDRARAYAEFCRKTGATPAELATRLAEDRSTIVNYLRLLDLPEEVQHLVVARDLTMGHARALAGIPDPNDCARLAHRILRDGMSVRSLEDVLRRRRNAEATDSTEAAGDTVALTAAQANVRDLQDRLQQAVGTKVTIKEGPRKGRGRVILEYYSIDDFNRIAQKLGLRD